MESKSIPVKREVGGGGSDNGPYRNQEWIEELGCSGKVKKWSYREDPEIRKFWVSIQR